MDEKFTARSANIRFSKSPGKFGLFESSFSNVGRLESINQSGLKVSGANSSPKYGIQNGYDSV